MAFQTKRVLKKAISWAGLLFFGLAAYMLYTQLSKYSFDDIKDAVFSIPAKNLCIYVILAKKIHAIKHTPRLLLVLRSRCLC